MTTMSTPRPALPVIRQAAGDDLRLVEPLPGFPDEETFTLTQIDPDGVLLAMRSTRDPGLRFVLTPAEVFFPDYRAELAPVIGRALDARGTDELRLLLVLTIGTGLGDATANLRAPIVFAPGTGRAMQVVLDDESRPMRQPLIA